MNKIYRSLTRKSQHEMGGTVVDYFHATAETQSAQGESDAVTAATYTGSQRMPKSSVLVTGATGFVGGAIARRCQTEGLTVRCTGRSASPRATLPNYVRADLGDANVPAELVANVNTIVHAAGLAHQFGKARYGQAQFTISNVGTTDNLVRAAAAHGVRHVVLVSSVSVYGPHSATICNEDHLCLPQEPYAQSKYDAEVRAVELSQRFGLKLTILRLATVYGEEDPGNVARLMRVIDRGRFAWVGTGSNLKSLIHRDDVARACVAVVRQPPDGVNIFNLSGPPSPMREIVETLAAALDRRLPRWRIPSSLALGVARLARAMGTKAGFLQRPYTALGKWLADDAYDSAKFNQRFSFEAQVPLAEGLRREVMWYRSLIQAGKS